MQPRPADTTNVPAAGGAGGSDPAEGRPDLGIPGADRPDALPDRNDDLPERLGERIGSGPDSGGVVTGEPDVLPDVEVPETTM